MKTVTKTVLASAVVIALCLCAVGGVTYSWFSDSEQSDIDITTGNIQLDMTVSNATVQSFNYPAKTLEEDTAVATDLGGLVTYSAEGNEDGTLLTISFSNAAPGDKLTFSVYGELRNTIEVVYYESYAVTSPAGSELEPPFTINNIDSTGHIYDAIASTDNPHEIYSSGDPKVITVEMDQNAGNEYQGLSYSIQIQFNAYQSNAPTDADSVVSDISDGSNSITVNNASGESAAIQFDNSGSATGSLTVSMVDTTDSDYYVEGESVLAGISVTTSDGGSNLSGIETTVTFLIDGDLSNVDLKIYHNGSAFNPTGGISKSYDSDTGKTTVSFVTTSGFSTYTLTAQAEATVDGTYYETLEGALEAATDNETVTLTADIQSETAITIDADTKAILDLNNHNISITGGHALSVYGTLTIQGDGKIECGANQTPVAGYEFVTIFARGNADITINGGEYLAHDCAEVIFGYENAIVTINEGVFSSTGYANTAWGYLLNVGDSSDSKITVNGGTFHHYNPALGDNALGTNAIMLGEGKGSYPDGDAYTVSDAVAEVDDTYYESIVEANQVADRGDIINILSDFTLEEDLIVKGIMYTPDDTNVTINLDGHTITCNSNTTLIQVSNGATVTINGGTITSTGNPIHVIYGGNVTVNDTVFNINGASSITVGTNQNPDSYDYVDTLALNDVAINSVYGAIVGYKNSKIDINGGTITDSVGGGVITNGSPGLNAQEWNITNVTFNIRVDKEQYPGEVGYIAVGIQCHNGDTWNISGCTFNIDHGVGISVRGGDVKITDCTYNYTNNEGWSDSSGRVQFTDTDIPTEVNHAVVACYRDGSYGYSDENGGNSSLIIDGNDVTDGITKEPSYFDFGTI